MTYGLIFWGKSPQSICIFRLQKRVIRIIRNSRKRDSCRNVFKKLEILALQSPYIFSVLLFVAENRELFITNSQIDNIDTGHNNNLHCPTCNLSVFQKRTYYFGIKVSNNIPPSITNIAHDIKQFKLALKRFLLLNSFYSLEEYFNHNID
jgi:hypothetical protein